MITDCKTSRKVGVVKLKTGSGAYKISLRDEGLTNSMQYMSFTSVASVASSHTWEENAS